MSNAPSHEAGLTAADLALYVRFDPKTNRLVWARDDPARGVRSGEEATRDIGGRLVVRIAGRTYTAARVSWCLAEGAWPPCALEHADGDRLNVNPHNLRPYDAVRTGGRRRTLGVVKRLSRWYPVWAGAPVGRGYSDRYLAELAYDELALERIGLGARLNHPDDIWLH